jgi:hypothetical protein
MWGMSTRSAGTPFASALSADAGNSPRLLAMLHPRTKNERSDNNRLSAAVNRPSERPLIADQWSNLTDNWLLTADLLSQDTSEAVPTPNNLEQTT